MAEIKTHEGDVLSRTDESAESIMNVPEEIKNLKMRIALLLEGNREIVKNADYTQGKTRFHDENIAEINGNIHQLYKEIEKSRMTREQDNTH